MLQFNSGSVPANTHKIRSRLEEQRPDLVLIQEINLKKNQHVKFDGHEVMRKDRATPRNSKISLEKEEH